MPKFAVITGASSGIGAEFARQLSARGYNLLLVARRADRLEKLSDQLTTVCEIFTADLSKKSECLRLVKALEGRRVDLFINNAGFGDCGPFLQTELDKDLDMLSVNIRALHILTKKIGQQLYKQGFGALLNVGSCAGLMPAGPYMATYYATKAYVVSLTSALAQELREARSPVYVGCLCPARSTPSSTLWRMWSLRCGALRRNTACAAHWTAWPAAKRSLCRTPWLPPA